MRVQFVIAGLLLGCVAALSGCGQPPPASFALNDKVGGDLISDASKKLEATLAENFGTPNNLVAWQQLPIDYGEAHPGAPAGSPRSHAGWRLVEGRNLYMQHCVHCHGTAGDGAGPTAKFLNPRPRDYRQGVFKFKSTQGALKPSRADLVHILEQGIPGTYMPSFVLLGDEQLNLLADYVRWLSSRGEVEIKLRQQLAALGASDKEVRQQVTKEKKRSAVVAEVMKSVDEEWAGMLAQAAGDVSESWTTGEDPASVIVPKTKRSVPTKDSLARGRDIFLGDKTKCADCHGPAGRGDGPQTEKFQAIPNTTPEQKYETPGLHDIWGHEQQPRNLTRGVYRGGRRPVDIFRRVHSGINGTQMPGFSTALSEEQMWDLVNYVLSIPFEGTASPYPTQVPAEVEKSVAATASGAALAPRE